jgi:hypothetical protein
MFNPNPHVTTLRFTDHHVCHLIDDALLDPEGLVRYSSEHAHEFRPLEQKGYPGICLPPPSVLTQTSEAFFARHARALFDARRILRMHCRLSLVTTPEDALLPYQMLCHRDGVTIAPRESIQASVLYLFRDQSLGGTSFYVPARAPDEIARLFADSRSLGTQEFTARYGIEPKYMNASNAYFTLIGTVSAKWNRLILYDGSMLHSGHIPLPGNLSSDPKQGRLTLNGFYTCRRHVA